MSLIFDILFQENEAVGTATRGDEGSFLFALLFLNPINIAPVRINMSNIDENIITRLYSLGLSALFENLASGIFIFQRAANVLDDRAQ